jgi:hypothetical protein
VAAAICRLDGDLCLLNGTPPRIGARAVPDGKPKAGAESEAEAVQGVGAVLEAAAGGAGAVGQRVICVGLGSGAMPAFIAKHFPKTIVEVIEIDPVVIEVRPHRHCLPCRPTDFDR